jgi:hypothetical protein
MADSIVKGGVYGARGYNVFCVADDFSEMLQLETRYQSKADTVVRSRVFHASSDKEV